METKITLLNPTTLVTRTNLFYLTIFALPMITHGPQLLIGTAVNLLLFLGAKKLTTKELIPLSILPSLGALTNGVLFGSLTLFLVYFAPVIWVSNYLMMKIFQQTTKLPTVLSVAIASIAKATMLFTVALIFFRLSIVPQIFLTAMGTIQLTTAVLGGLLALTITKLGLIESEKI